MSLPTLTRKPDITLPNNWRERHYQEAAWDYLCGGGLRCGLVWHRRAGKDDLALHWTAVAAHQRPATYWHMLPQQAQARKAIWEAVDPHSGKRRIDMAFPLEIRASTNEGEMLIRFKNGSIWRVVGSDNYDALVGSPPAGVVMSEWPLADPRAWGYLSPILAENGGWAIFAYTPRGKNHGWSLYNGMKSDPKWHVEVKTVDDTGVIDAEALADDLATKIAIESVDQGKALYEQEWFCSFEAAITGAYYGSEMKRATDNDRICGLPVERGPEVHTAWDIGIDDATAIWFAQMVGREVRVVDYYEDSGQDAAHYAGVLNDKGYTYGEHLMPHDAGYREKGTGKTYEQQIGEAGLRGSIRVLPRTNNLIADINTTRQFISQCWFDEKRCDRGIEALRQYRRQWNDKLQTWHQRPLHDWTSHGSDAFRSLATGFEGTKKVKLPKRTRSPWAN